MKTKADSYSQKFLEYWNIKPVLLSHVIHPLKWRKPKPNWFKVNSYAAQKKDYAGIGRLIRDSNGE